MHSDQLLGGLSCLLRVSLHALQRMTARSTPAAQLLHGAACMKGGAAQVKHSARAMESKKRCKQASRSHGKQARKQPSPVQTLHRLSHSVRAVHEAGDVVRCNRQDHCSHLLLCVGLYLHVLLRLLLLHQCTCCVRPCRRQQHQLLPLV